MPGTKQGFEAKDFKTDYESSQHFGSLQLGEKALYVRRLLRCFVLPYPQIGRIYRRVMRVPRGKRESVDFEYLVVEDVEGQELAQLQMRTREESQKVIKLLEPRLPWVSFTCHAGPGPGGKEGTPFQRD